MIMKRILFTLALFSFSLLNAQSSDETLLQPRQISARRLNAAGEVTKEYLAFYSHSGEGKLVAFGFQEFGVSCGWEYDGDYLKRIGTNHAGGYPMYFDAINYTYENGKIRFVSHLWDAMNSDEYWEYNYYDDGRLARMDYGSFSPDNYCCHWLYEYMNDGRTKVVSYVARTFVEGMVVERLGARSTYEYGVDFALLSLNVDTYNNDGVITKSERTFYQYNQDGMLVSEIKQILTDGEWVNSSIKRTIYREDGRVAEQQTGSWSAETGDWDIDRKVVQDYSAEDLTYTVTFYKKQADEWVYATFNNQTLFSEPELKEHQRALGYFVHEDMMGSANVNQFVFTLEETCVPIYLSSAERNQDARFKVFPNPGTDVIQVAAPTENAVIRFYDIQGRLVFAQPFDFNTTIHTDSWAEGIYIWEVWDGFDKASCGKWIKK